MELKTVCDWKPHDFCHPLAGEFRNTNCIVKEIKKYPADRYETVVIQPVGSVRLIEYWFFDLVKI